MEDRAAGRRRGGTADQVGVTGTLGKWVFERNGNAVASVLFAIAGLLVFGVILGPIAIGLGLLAKRQIRDHEAAGVVQAGGRTATVGIVIGIIAFVIPIVLLAV